jgi:alkylation response protein AidB-like acyl-CoA dehydrogenase
MSDIVVTETRDASAIADELARTFARTAVERDRLGGTARKERDLLRRSGLLRMSIPEPLGGWGAGWPEVMAIVRRLARADGSLAHLFGFHHLLLATVRLFGARAQWTRLQEDTARNAWFWGNALNPRDPRTRLARAADGYVLSGSKSFCSGASDADMLVVSALAEADGRLAVAAIPATRPGIAVLDDWDSMGQRQTDSGTVEFHGVRVAEDELLRTPGPLGSVFASLRPCIAQLVLCNVYLGLGEGALDDARGYTRAHRQPGAAAGTAAPSPPAPPPPDPPPPDPPDPYVLHHYGTMWVELEGARLLTDRAAEVLQRAWAREDELTPRERGECAIAVATAKVATTRAGLDVATRIYDVMSARATSRGAGFDRYWRNLRTHTLHDPVDHKLRELGDFALHDEIPRPSFYS